MSWLARVRRLTRNFISHGFGPPGGAGPPPTTKGCLDLSIAPTTALLITDAPTAGLDVAGAPAFVLEVSPYPVASLLLTTAPTASLLLTFEAC